MLAASWGRQFSEKSLIYSLVSQTLGVLCLSGLLMETGSLWFRCDGFIFFSLLGKFIMNSLHKNVMPWLYLCFFTKLYTFLARRKQRLKCFQEEATVIINRALANMCQSVSADSCLCSLYLSPYICYKSPMSLFVYLPQPLLPWGCQHSFDLTQYAFTFPSWVSLIVAWMLLLSMLLTSCVTLSKLLSIFWAFIQQTPWTTLD